MSDYGDVLTCAHEFGLLDSQNTACYLFDACWIQTGMDFGSFGSFDVQQVAS